MRSFYTRLKRFKFVEEEEAYLMKAMQTMKMPIANVDMAQDKKDAQEVGARGRCFANSSTTKKLAIGFRLRLKGAELGVTLQEILLLFRILNI
ncbi:hypothetical protein CTI12_AA605710 [Artemisia annua]|uniref:Uncharacterized protein n=1 Tax=Artemisia annua TaxID=35608 RepID=A0A2U1KGG0_ARTAN|nr:hypothetical protein CTI12_AA605710 [Artemisia annua]